MNTAIFGPVALLATIVVAVAVLSGLVVWRVAIPDSVTRTARFIVPVEGGHEMGSGQFPRLAVSPDGHLLAYVAQGQLFVRPLDRLEAILGVDISIISTGPERDQTILLPTRTLKQWGLV